MSLGTLGVLMSHTSSICKNGDRFLMQRLPVVAPDYCTRCTYSLPSVPGNVLTAKKKKENCSGLL